MLWFLLLLCCCVGPLMSGGGAAVMGDAGANGQRDDYLQPYKFVKPLEGLSELYGSMGTAGRARKATLKDSEKKSGSDSLMPDEMKAPPPAATEVNYKARRRLVAEAIKKMAAAEKKEEEETSDTTEESSEDKTTMRSEREDEAEEDVDISKIADAEAEDDEAGAVPASIASDRMLNVSSEADKLEERSLPPSLPEPEALRIRIPPRPEDEYYYYYYDDYYDDYYNLPSNGPSKGKKEKNVAAPSSSSSRPSSSNSKSRHSSSSSSKPPGHLPATHRLPSPKESYRLPPFNKDKKPTADMKHKTSSKDKPRGESRPSDTRRKEEVYNISNTLKRLSKIKQGHEKYSKKGVSSKPKLPNPWDKINLPPPPKMDKRLKRPDPKPKKPLISARPPPVPVDYYYDDYYYDHRPFPAIKRQGPAASTGKNPLALLVAPLAGIALLTAAATVAVSPVLFTVSLTGKRRKRDAGDEGISPELEEKIHEMEVLETFLSSVPETTNYQHQVLSMYLSCSGYDAVDNYCLDRVVCEYADNDSGISEEERDVISIILFNIMSNDYVSDEYKERLKLAARTGRDDKTCSAFECSALSEMKKNDL